MGIKVKALLLDNVFSRTENAFLKESAECFYDCPCEMKFEAYHGWMDHENSEHAYLPVFHILGHITELHFNKQLPYDITSVYFDEKDRTKLLKDILYYPTPDELVHLIKTGKYFTKDFQIPEVLSANSYDFPCMANVKILSPVLVDDMDGLQVPLIYIGLNGTGVSRKNDKLLDYYGIEFDSRYPVYALTAESSGYVDPSLMMYLEEPKVEHDKSYDFDKSDYYITPEEEAQMMTNREMERQPEVEPDVSKDFSQSDYETMVLASADRAISRRVEQKWLKKLNKQNVVESVHDGLTSSENEKIEDVSKSNSVETSEIPSYQDSEFLHVDEPSNSYVTNSFVNTVETDESLESSNVLKNVAPDEPEQLKEIKIPEFGIDGNMVKKSVEEDSSQLSPVEESLDETVDDDSKIVDKGDVSDVELQKKLNEKQGRVMLRNSAQELNHSDSDNFENMGDYSNDEQLGE